MNKKVERRRRRRRKRFISEVETRRVEKKSQRRSLHLPNYEDNKEGHDGHQ